MSFKTASAILRGKWLIDPAYASAHLPLVLNMIKSGSDNSAEVIEKRTAAASAPPTRISHMSSGKTTGLFSVSPYTSLDRLPYNSIAQVDIIGPISKYGDWCSWGTMELSDLMIRLSNSDRVKGILLNIDTPGGQVEGTATLAETIRTVSKIKPVLGIVQDGMAASAGMWIGSAPQELYVTRATDAVGSIGAYCTIYDFSGYFEMNGVKVQDIYAPQSEDKNKPYREAISGNDSLIKEDLKFCVDQFTADVQKYRGARLNVAKENPFTGKLYNAKEALKIGLIDGIKPLSWVITRMEQLISLRA